MVIITYLDTQKKKKFPNESHFNILTQQKNKTKVYKIIVK